MSARKRGKRARGPVVVTPPVDPLCHPDLIRRMTRAQLRGLREAWPVLMDPDLLAASDVEYPIVQVHAPECLSLPANVCCCKPAPATLRVGARA